jgi:hypothetical protein
VSRRARGRGKLIIGLGAIVTLLGAAPPWWTVGGTVTPTVSGNGFEEAGIVVFIAALALLALIVLPFATRGGDTVFDRPLSYMLLAVPAIGAFLLRVLQIQEQAALGFPDRAPGLWLTGGGLALVAWGVAELLVQRPLER